MRFLAPPHFSLLVVHLTNILVYFFAFDLLPADCQKFLLCFCNFAFLRLNVFGPLALIFFFSYNPFFFGSLDPNSADHVRAGQVRN